MKKTFFIFMALLLLNTFLIACQSSRENKWNPPKFVKEWEIKTILPELPHHIISMTANSKGIFVLIKADELKYIPPKKTNRMTEEELKDEKFFFGRILTDVERKSRNIGKTIENNYYYIQHYDFEGHFIKNLIEGNKLKISDEIRNKIGMISIRKQPGEALKDSRNELIKPLILISDEDENIYVADYEGNKIVKFDAEGNVLNIWRIETKEALAGYYDTLSRHRGMSSATDKLYIIFNENIIYGSKISIYDLNGKLLSAKELPILHVPAMNPYEFPAKRIPIKNIEENVDDMVVDKEGNIYLLVGMIKVFKFNKNFKEVKSFEPILKEGFETDIEIYNPETKKREKYSNSWIKKFDSQKGSGFGLDIRYYELDKVYLSPKNELFVTFLGQKPFGVINAIIYDTDGEMLGYWKEEEKSRSEWYKNLNNVERIKSKDVNLSLAFNQGSIFIGKTIQYRKGDTLRSDVGPELFHSIIQRFDR